MTPSTTILPGFRTDLDALPLAAKKVAVLALADVRDGRRRGVALDNRPSVGDLSDCFKLYFDPDPRAKPRYRLVYKMDQTGLAAVALIAVAVGQRQNLDAYLRAVRNLGR